MRLHAPVGIWLLLWPCWWGVTLAARPAPPPLPLLGLFLLGSVFMRSAGCIINDLFDRRIDREVARTRTRPLASGEVSAAEALVLLGFLLTLALIVALLLGRAIVLLSCLWLLPVLLYPLMKRITWWPQLFLGLTFNAGALFGWIAVRGRIEWPAVLLYAAGVFWTLGYDTLYALQDREDDARIGVKSTALLLGNNVRFWVGMFYTAFVALLAAAGALSMAAPMYFLLLSGLALLLGAQLRAVDQTRPETGVSAFFSNAWIGGFVFLMLVLSC
jgi:4-hydroxybenzoate polyprenyltransferase